MNRRYLITRIPLALIVNAILPFRVFAGLKNHSRGEYQPDELARIQAEFTDVLEKTLMAWFPRTLDTDYGGFLCNFNSRWEPDGPHDKALEFQARQTRAAAQAAIFNPDYQNSRDAAEHGFRYLKDLMWDSVHGGWFRKLDRQGNPLESETKHGHGTAYAIQACIEHHRLTGDTESLNLAYDAFLWLEQNAHDDNNGGYYNFYRRDGKPITSRENNPLNDYGLDHMGTPVELRDENTAMDLLEAFADLYSVKQDPLIELRLLELIRLCTDRLSISSGFLVKFYHRDWSPSPSEVELGITMQTSRSLIKASETLQIEENFRNKIKKTEQQMVNSCVNYAWDKKHGGFYYNCVIENDSVIVTSKFKAWWTQAEGLRSLISMAANLQDTQIDYHMYFNQLWNYITNNIIDSEYKGWKRYGDDISVPSEVLKYGPEVKSDEWKDASHEVRALIECIQALDKFD